MVKTPLVLFSDNDINWAPYAIQVMFQCLKRYPSLSFAYGAYELNGKIWCNKEFDYDFLRKKNYISTMSMVRTADHPGWDESLKRLQDWDVWLTITSRGKIGRYIGMQLFTTPVRSGITRNGISLDEARSAIAKKHNLNL